MVVRPVGRGQLLVGRGRWSVVSGRWSVVGGQWSVVGGQWSVVSAFVVAVVAVLPLLVPELWVGFRLGMFDTALAVIAPTEQPLSIRSRAGPWAIGLALAWCGLAYWQRTFAWWEAALVVVG